MSKDYEKQFSAEWRGARVSGDEHAVKSAIAEMEAAAKRSALRRERWGPDLGPHAMEILAASFPSLVGVPGTSPWDATMLLRWLCTSGAPTGGSRQAARFVLGVWNSHSDWSELAEEEGFLDREKQPELTRLLQSFSVFDALNIWDRQHHNAFLRWAESPFFP